MEMQKPVLDQPASTQTLKLTWILKRKKCVAQELPLGILEPRQVQTFVNMNHFNNNIR